MMVRAFLSLCQEIKFPVSIEKTAWASNRVVFLGILLDGEFHCLSIPEDKRLKALNQLQIFINRRKATVRELQSLAGLLNFLCKAVHPGRVFTRRIHPRANLSGQEALRQVAN